MITKFIKFFAFLGILFFCFVFLDFLFKNYIFKNFLPNITKKKVELSEKGRLKILYPDGEKIFEKAELRPQLDYSDYFLIEKKIRESPSYILKRFGLYLGIIKIEISPRIVFYKKPLEEFILSLKYRYNTPPVDAKFVFENGKVKEFRKEKRGIAIDEKELWKEVETKFSNWFSSEDIEIRIKLKEIEPSVKLSDINSFGIEELIASGSSSFKGSSVAREHNIILATSRINGMIVPKEEIFSFNKALGEVSAATGYKQAYIIKDGKTILGDGGGVCQVSTTLFRAVLKAGLPIIERHAHSYRVFYYEQDSKPGFDATVFAPTVDFKFKNDTPAYILIQGKVDKKNKKLYFYIYGKKDGRKVYISTPKIYDVVPPPEPLYIEDPTLPTGQIKQIDFSAWGAKVIFTYKVEKNGRVLFEKIFRSIYRPWQAVYLIGKG